MDKIAVTAVTAATPNVATVATGQATLRPQRRDSKHDLLVSEARRAFADLGVAGTHIADVAARAGIRKSTFFHYFADKDSLYAAAVTNGLQRIADEVDQAAMEGASATERVERIVACIHGRLDGDGALARLLLRGLLEKTGATDAGTPAERITARLADTISLRDGGAHDAAQAASSVLAIVCLHQSPSARTAGGAVPTAAERLAEVQRRVQHFLDAT